MEDGRIVGGDEEKPASLACALKDSCEKVFLYHLNTGFSFQLTC